MEKLIPRAPQDLATFPEAAGAQRVRGRRLPFTPRSFPAAARTGEVDGPEEFHVVLLDAGRMNSLADPNKRQSLYCIRCGACLNHCPVYRKIGGYSFPWIYSGPIGAAIITPQFHGVGSEPGLPFASSLCALARRCVRKDRYSEDSARAAGGGESGRERSCVEL